MKKIILVIFSLALFEAKSMPTSSSYLVQSDAKKLDKILDSLRNSFHRLLSKRDSIDNVIHHVSKNSSKYKESVTLYYDLWLNMNDICVKIANRKLDIGESNTLRTKQDIVRLNKSADAIKRSRSTCTYPLK